MSIIISGGLVLMCDVFHSEMLTKDTKDQISKMEKGKVAEVVIKPTEAEKPFGPVAWKALLIVG